MRSIPEIHGSRRGFSPGDEKEFGGPSGERLLDAAEDVRFLLGRGYEISSAVTFVGNHFLLSKRQRMALLRGVSSREAVKLRAEKEVKKLPDEIWIDGFNTIITLETALSGSVLIGCDDGTVRDLAGLYGTYRLIDKTYDSVGLLLRALERESAGKVHFLFDQPVSNSGRLCGLIREKAGEQSLEADAAAVPDVDRQLMSRECVVTSDRVILDACGGWFNLNRRILEKDVPEAWVLQLLRK